MRLDELIAVCKAFNDLGWAIQEQLDDVVADSSRGPDCAMDKCNPNALRLIDAFLKTANDRFDDTELATDVRAIRTAIQKRRK